MLIGSKVLTCFLSCSSPRHSTFLLVNFWNLIAWFRKHACAFRLMFWPSVRLLKCQYHCSIAQNVDIVSWIPAPRRVLVPAGRPGAEVRSRAKACLPLFAAAIQPQGHPTAPRTTLAGVEPPATARHTPSCHLNPGGGSNWTVTLANCQAGTIYISRHWPSKQDVSWHSYIRSSFTYMSLQELHLVKGLSPTVFRTESLWWPGHGIHQAY